MANLKSEVDKLDVDKLVVVKNGVVKNNVVKKTDYHKLVAKLDKIDTSNSVKKTDYNTKITEIEEKIPDTSNLATKTALTTVENKISDTNSLVKKSDYNTKISGIENNIEKLQAYDLSYFKGKQYFDEGSGKQNYLVFLLIGKYFKLNSVVGVIDRVLSWQSKGISNVSIKPPTTSNNSFNPR